MVTLKHQGILLGRSCETLVVSRLASGEWTHPDGRRLQNGSLHVTDRGIRYELSCKDGRWTAAWTPTLVQVCLHADEDPNSEIQSAVTATLTELGAHCFGETQIAEGDVYMHHDGREYVLTFDDGGLRGYERDSDFRAER